MERFNTIKKFIIAPALVIALTAGSAMAGPRQHFGGTDRLGSAMSDRIASRADAKYVAGYGIDRIADFSPRGAPQSVGTSASGSRSELGAIREDDPAGLGGSYRDFNCNNAGVVRLAEPAGPSVPCGPGF